MYDSNSVPICPQQFKERFNQQGIGSFRKWQVEQRQATTLNRDCMIEEYLYCWTSVNNDGKGIDNEDRDLFTRSRRASSDIQEILPSLLTCGPT